MVNGRPGGVGGSSQTSEMPRGSARSNSETTMRTGTQGREYEVERLVQLSPARINCGMAPANVSIAVPLVSSRIEDGFGELVLEPRRLTEQRTCDLNAPKFLARPNNLPVTEQNTRVSAT